MTKDFIITKSKKTKYSIFVFFNILYMEQNIQAF